MTETPAQLPLRASCRECQRRKIKCDRHHPCGRCVRLTITCTPSTRKPRARNTTGPGTNKPAVSAKSASHHQDLRQRIGRLERLVKSLSEQDTPAQSVAPEASTPSTISNTARYPSQLIAANKYVGGSFWTTLASEVNELAEAFEDEENDESSDHSSPDQDSPFYHAPSTSLSTQSNSGIPPYELILCAPGVIYIMPGALQDISVEAETELYEVFIKHSESMHKHFHRPTLEHFYHQGNPYLGKPADAPCNRALKASICFAAATSLTDRECWATYGKSATDLVAQLQRSVDIAIYQANPLNTTDLATFQALMLYATSVRKLDSGRRAWSIVGLLARLATALHLPNKLSGETPFMAEIRCRAWWNLIFLDFYTSIDRGTDTAVKLGTWNRPFPSNCNDDEFNESSSFIPNHEGRVTDATKILIAFHAADASLRVGAPGLTWKQRLDIAYRFQTELHTRFLRYCDAGLPEHRVMFSVVGVTSCAMLLRAVRPLEHDDISTPPAVNSPWVMQIAVNILRHCDELWKFHTHGFRRMPWVPWHAMAVALAGLCSTKGTDLAEEAWHLVDLARKRYSQYMADAPHGLLSRPIQTLYRKAVAFRTEGAIANGRTPKAPVETAPESGPTDAAMPDLIYSPGAWDSFMFDAQLDAVDPLPMTDDWFEWEAILKDMDGVVV